MAPLGDDLVPRGHHKRLYLFLKKNIDVTVLPSVIGVHRKLVTFTSIILTPYPKNYSN